MMVMEIVVVGVYAPWWSEAWPIWKRAGRVEGVGYLLYIKDIRLK
jgi:hypothetical protein